MAGSFGYLLVIFILSLGSPGVTSDVGNQTRWHMFNITCDAQDVITQEERCESESLETIVDIVRKQKLLNVQINIQTARLKLTSIINFSALESLMIRGDYGMTSIICTAGSNVSAGIILSDIVGTITLNRLNITLCGCQVQERYYNGSGTYRSALAILYCMNVQLNRVIIAASRGLGLSILNHQGGRVNINATTFKDNILPQDYFLDSVFGGGGVYIHLDQPQCIYRQHGHYCLVPMMFQFSNCTFGNNTAHTFSYRFGSTNYLGNVEKKEGRGGGVHLSIRSGMKDIYASFSNCTLTDNHAFVGGGIYAKIHRETDNITIEIKDSLFKHNGCGNSKNTSTTYGGAVYLGFSAYVDGQGVVINNSHYLVRNVNFIENCAELGGGVMYYSEHGKRGVDADNINNSMLFDNCTFIANRAHIGSAVDLIPSVFVKSSTGYRVVATFNHCYFLKNSVTIKLINSSQTQESQTTAGIGTIYASEHDILFNGNNIFESNEGTAVHIVNGIINCVNSSMSFINNTGIQGGAMALIGSSMITVGPNEYEFINNSARYQGGAIYILLTDTIDFIVSRRCFIQYNTNEISAVPWDATIKFRGNRAIDNTAGHAIYATSLHPCQMINNGTEKQPDFIFIDTSEVFHSRGIVFQDDIVLYPQIATDGAVFHYISSKLVIIPGEKREHSVTITDDLHQLVKAPLRVAIPNKHIQLNLANSTFVGD